MGIGGFNMSKVGLGPTEPLSSAKDYRNLISILVYGGISIDSIKTLMEPCEVCVCSDYNPDSIRSQYTENPSILDIQRVFLLTGMYGDFPAITVPKTNTVEWLHKNSRDIDSKTDIFNIREHVAYAVPDVSPVEAIEHEDMYRVVNFLTCIRHEIIAAYMKKREINWNPLVSFTAPFYYRKGTMRNWVMDNNILKSEIIEFIYNISHFLVASAVIKKGSYDFYPLIMSSADIERLGVFDYIKKEEVMNTVCFIVSKMISSLNMFNSMLRRLPVEDAKVRITQDNLFESLQEMFRKLNNMANYISIL